MAIHGSLGEFDQLSGDWKSYIERAQQYFTANDITGADKQKAILLSCIGDRTYNTMKDVLAPAAPISVSLAEIIKKMSEHFQPAPSEIVKRFQFHTRVCRPQESLADYITQLNQIASFCNFGDANSIKEMVWDRLVCGIANDSWQKRLLAEDKLTFDKAKKLLTALEAAEKGTRDLAPESNKQIHYLPHSCPRRRDPPARGPQAS